MKGSTKICSVLLSAAVCACAASRVEQYPEAQSAPVAPPRKPGVDADLKVVAQQSGAELLLNAGVLIAAHCARCHDQTSSLNLRTVPALSDRETWKKIALAVKSGRMPPTSPDREFPLEHQLRQRLTALASALSALGKTARPRPVVYASMTWVAIVHEVADRFLGAREVDRVVLRYRGGIGGLRDDLEPQPTPTPMLVPLAQMNMNRISYELCRAMVAVDAKAPIADRRLLPATRDVRANDALALTVHQCIHGTRGSADDHAQQLAMLEDVQAHGGDLLEAATALCASELSGPRIMVAPATGDL